MSDLLGSVFRVLNIFESEDVADFPQPHFSKREVRRAGDALRGQLLWTPGSSDEAARIFRIAYDWRNSHAYPMRRIRQEMAGKVKKLNVDAFTAARTKRMSSIRKKLANQSTMELTQIQDLGGARAVYTSLADLNILVSAYRNGISRHDLKRDTDYVVNPRVGGYRSHHFVFAYSPEEDDEAFNGRLIEVQIRTRFQHAWATAVEAVGLVRREDLKGGVGDKDWLRLFDLMSFELSDLDNGKPDHTFADRKRRREELKQLDNKIDASSFLRDIGQAFRASESYMNSSARYYSLQYDGENQTVTIKGFSSSVGGAEFYSSAETADTSSRNTVLVEVDKVENLRAAFPNYYLDVAQFSKRLNYAVEGRERDHGWLIKYRRSGL